MTTRVYVEGGGSGNKALRSACRRAFGEFFRESGLESLPRVVPCGGRNETYDDFRHARLGPGQDRVLLLVDSERPVAAADPWRHLAASDGWRRPRGARQEDAHLMVECMESWFYADKETLITFFGDGFVPSALSRANVEEIPKGDVLRGLAAASRRSQRGTYDKGRHAFTILGLLDPAKVCASSPHARRLIDVLHGRAPERR